MADITMCTQTLCPNAGHCYRVQAVASDWQSVMNFQYAISLRGVECDKYLPMHQVTASDSSVHNRRFYISPNGERSRWMLTHVMRATHPDWLDATDWPDEKLAEFIMINSSEEAGND